MKKIIFLMVLATCLNYFACHKCEEIILEPCGGAQTIPKVDLIVLMDQSGSIGSAATSVSTAAQNAIDSALKSCPSDLRVLYLGLDGVTWPTTLFTQSHRDYLYAIHGNSIPLAADMNHLGLATEQGANAIEDLSSYFDWRDLACRAIFYISDEELDSSDPWNDFLNEDQVTQDAILAANNNKVTVFTHFIDHQNLASSIAQNYADLTNETGGINFITNNQNVPPRLYQSFMPKIICNSCNACELNELLK